MNNNCSSNSDEEPASKKLKKNINVNLDEMSKEERDELVNRIIKREKERQYVFFIFV